MNEHEDEIDVHDVPAADPMTDQSDIRYLSSYMYRSSLNLS